MSCSAFLFCLVQPLAYRAIMSLQSTIHCPLNFTHLDYCLNYLGCDCAANLNDPPLASILSSFWFFLVCSSHLKLTTKWRYNDKLWIMILKFDQNKSDYLVSNMCAIYINVFYQRTLKSIICVPLLFIWYYHISNWCEIRSINVSIKR